MITQEDYDFYDNSGYLHLKNVLSDELLAGAQHDIDRLFADEDPVCYEQDGTPGCEYLQFVSYKGNALNNLIQSSIVTDVAAELLDTGTLTMFWDTLFRTPKNSTYGIPFHRDTDYLPMFKHGPAINCWIPLGDIPDGHGMNLIKDTHKRSGKVRSYFGEGIIPEDSPYYIPGERISFTFNKGDILLMNNNMIHGTLETINTVEAQFDRISFRFTSNVFFSTNIEPNDDDITKIRFLIDEMGQIANDVLDNKATPRFIL